MYQDYFFQSQKGGHNIHITQNLHKSKGQKSERPKARTKIYYVMCPEDCDKTKSDRQTYRKPEPIQYK